MESMCIMGEIEGATTTQDLTTQMVEYWYHELIDVYPSELNYSLNDIMKEVVHKPDPNDPSGAVLDYIHEVVTNIWRLGMGEIMTDETKSRQVVKKLINGLKPNEL